MPHEIFVIEHKSELNEQEKNRVAYLRDKLSTAKGLGLMAQASSIEADLVALEKGRLITTSPMSDTELAIWGAWLPTVYTDIGDNKHLQLANYNFDRIPDLVLKVWQKCKESGAFERFEIWTPENPQPDPILVGVNGIARHLLARWGESDVNLVSFDDIKRELVRRWHKNEDIGGEPFNQRWARTQRNENAFMTAMFSAALIFMGVGVGLTSLTASSGIGLSVGGMIAVACGAAIFHYNRKNTVERLLQSSPLMQAIAKDDSRPRETYA